MLSGSHLIHRVDVQRSTNTYDDAGMPGENFSTVSTGVACLIQRRTGKMVDDESDQKYYPSHFVFMRNGENVQVGDQLVDEDSVEYMVKAVNQAGGLRHHIEIEADLMEAGMR